jgi:glycine betaine/proline transport system substrate-binding protein
LLRSIGYSPTVTVLSVPVTFASMQNKDIDVFLGNWMPAQAADRKPLRRRRLGRRDRSESDRRQVHAGGAGLHLRRRPQRLQRYQRFAPELNDSIYGIEPGNDGNRHVLEMLKQNQFGLGGFKLSNPASRGMLAQVERAYRDKKPIVFLAWDPHPMNMRFDLKYLRRRRSLRPELWRRHHLHRDPQGLQRPMPECRPLLPT